MLGSISSASEKCRTRGDVDFAAALLAPQASLRLSFLLRAFRSQQARLPQWGGMPKNATERPFRRGGGREHT